MTAIAVIGFGRFGQLLVNLLLAHTSADILVVSGRRHQSQSRVTFISYSDLTQADVVIPTVPISAFSDTLERMCPFLKSDCLVVDVCSVKTYPVQVMLEKLPSSVSILATHPLFGPDSVAKNGGLRNLILMTYPVRINGKKYQKIRTMCNDCGLKVVEMEPQVHDQYMATTQLYSFLIGNLTAELHLTPTPLDTYWYHFLLEQSQSVANDGAQLFHDLIAFNPYARQFLEKFTAAQNQVISKIIIPR